MAKVLKNTTETVVIDSGYYLYIDTSLDINSRLYGTYAKEYDASDSDYLFAKVPDAQDLELKRKVEGKRYLHSVNKLEKDSIAGLCKLLTFTYTPETKDTRKYIIDNDEVTVIEYSDKSFAIFPKSSDMMKRLQTYENKFFSYKFLTGPGMKRTKGYILSKASPKRKEIMGVVDSKSKDSEADELVGDDIVPIGDPTSSAVRFKIWGSSGFIASKFKEIDEQDTMSYKVISEKDLDPERKVFEIEVIESYE